VSHGIVLGDDGQKMSKSLRNYPDPMVVFDTYGADAMRWYLLSSAILRGADFSVTEAGIRETVRQVLLPLWNSWYFLGLYANAEDVRGRVRVDSSNVLDRYILAKTSDLVSSVTADLDSYDLFSACANTREFLDILTNWYIRRSRDRFWSGDVDAVDTLHTVLETLCRVAAPLLPLITDTVYEGLTGGSSVHLTDWPSANDLPSNPELVRAMDRVREVCSVALSIRKAHARRVRLPLAELKVSHPDAESLRDFIDIIADEVNVKSVVLSSVQEAGATAVLQVIPGALGPRLGGRTQEVIKAVKVGDWTHENGVVVAGGIELVEGEYTIKMAAAEGAAGAALSDGLGMVGLDIVVTPELAAEGTARDLIRLVQQARRDADLDVSDRIELTLGVSESVRRQVSAFVDMISRETLAVSVAWGGGEPNANLEDEPVHIGVVPSR
ncbi:MAG: isoleucine--tRNA ligase, partial [Acidimicrobiia bacterium]|nr:isoleucine--tRNA ligase [Acidimicrobiia bacterium]